MRPYTHRQVLGGTVDYGTPTVISSKVISSQCLGPETIYTRYLDRAPTEGNSDFDDGDDVSCGSSDDQGAWPPTIVPLNDDDARSLTSQKVISQLISQHAPTFQQKPPTPPLVHQAALQAATSGQSNRFTPFAGPMSLSPPMSPAVAPPASLRPMESAINAPSPTGSQRPPVYRPPSVGLSQFSSLPAAASQTTTLGRDDVQGCFPSPRNLPTAETPRFIPGWEPSLVARPPPQPPLHQGPQLATASPSYAVLGKLPSFGAAPAPQPVRSYITPLAPIVTNRGVTITTLGNAISPTSRVQNLQQQQQQLLQQQQQPINGVRSQHIVQGGSSSPPFHPTHPRLVVTDRALARGRHQRLIKAPPTTGFWESPIKNSRRHTAAAAAAAETSGSSLGCRPHEDEVPTISRSNASSPGFCQSKFLDTIHRWFGVA